MKRTAAFKNPILIAILALAAFLRFYQLDAIPPGFQFDQAFNAFDLLRLLQGQFEIFFPANTGREPLYFYLSMTSVALFGTTAFAIKLTSAVIGLLTIPLIYGFTRSFFAPPLLGSSAPYRGNARIALLAAFLSAISFWHLFFSRDGLRVILEVPLTLLTFWYLWRALSQSLNLSTLARRARPGDSLGNAGVAQSHHSWVMAGIFLALSLYTYPSARLLPLAIIFLAAYAAWNDRSRFREYLKGTLTAFAVCAVLVAPLSVYFALHPDQFIAHTESISVLDARVNEGNIPAAIWRNLLAILGMFFVRGDPGSIHNLPYRPIFDPFVAVLFVVGVAVMFIALLTPSPLKGEDSASRTNRTRAIFLATWIAISLASSLFSDQAPDFLRMLPAFPAIVILPAWGASAIWGRLTGFFARRLWIVALSIIFAISAGLTFRDYFLVFANLPELYYTFDVDKVDISDWINSNAGSSRIFLAPLWYQQGTISLLTHNAPLGSFESRDTIVLPSRAAGKDAIYGFPPEQDRKVQTMAERLGSLGARDDVANAKNHTVLLTYRIPAKNLPDPQNPSDAFARGGAFIQPQKIERANWSNQIELLGYTLDPGAKGRNPSVSLFLRSLAQMSDDYTFSIKVSDDKHRVWGQEDKWTGDNSYETSHWGVGDIIIEKFYPGLNSCAPAGNYHVTVEAYNPKNSNVLSLTDREGSAVALAAMQANASQGNRFEDLDPEQTKELAVSSNLQMIGYNLTPDTVRAGDSFSLSLFWRGIGKGGTEKIIVRLGDANLLESMIQVPAEGRGLCTSYDFVAPASLAPGASTIWLNDKQLAILNLVK